MDQVCKYVAICIFIDPTYGIAKMYTVNELEYASNLLQSTELTANSSVHRFETSYIVELQ